MNTLQKKACIFSLAALMAGSMAPALQLEDLKLPLTRTEADNTLTKDYSYRFLEDMSVRRSWHLKGKTVHVDFRITRPEQAICIAVEYNKPVSRKTVHEDIKTLTGGKCNYKKLGKPKKGTNTYGMEHARGAKFRAEGASADSWVFVEHTTKSQKKCSRLVYYAKKPTKDRLALTELTSGGGYTAMGSSGPSVNLAALRENEEKRRAIKPQPKLTDKKVDLSMDITGIPEETEPVAATTPADEGAFDMLAESDLESDEAADGAAAGGDATAADSAKGFLPEAVSAPVRKMLANAGIGVSAMVADVLTVVLPLLLILIVWRVIAGKVRKSKSRKAFDAIVKKNQAEKEEQG